MLGVTFTKHLGFRYCNVLIIADFSPVGRSTIIYKVVELMKLPKIQHVCPDPLLYWGIYTMISTDCTSPQVTIRVFHCFYCVVRLLVGDICRPTHTNLEHHPTNLGSTSYRLTSLYIGSFHGIRHYSIPTLRAIRL